MSIAFIGLGSMGSGIAANLVKAGHDVTVWNRSPGKAADLVAAGAREAGTAAEAVADATVAFSILADDAALLAVLRGEGGLLKGLPERALHVSLSTISVATADRVAREHAEHGQRYLSAPVFGRPIAAAAGQLSIVAAGAAGDIDEAEPYFKAMGPKLFRVGETPSAANLVKLCGNFMILSAIETMGEAMTLAAKGGVPKAMLHEVMTNTLFDAPPYKNYGRMIVEDHYQPVGFKAPLGLKDMRLVGDSAAALRVPMPLLGVLRDHLLQTIAIEGDDTDWSGIGRTIGKNAGL